MSEIGTAMARDDGGAQAVQEEEDHQHHQHHRQHQLDLDVLTEARMPVVRSLSTSTLQPLGSEA
jgi:hypothetical protein